MELDVLLYKMMTSLYFNKDLIHMQFGKMTIM